MNHANVKGSPAQPVRTAEVVAGLGTAVALEFVGRTMGCLSGAARRTTHQALHASTSLSTGIAVGPLRAAAFAARVAADAGTGALKALKFARPPMF